MYNHLAPARRALQTDPGRFACSSLVRQPTVAAPDMPPAYLHAVRVLLLRERALRLGLWCRSQFLALSTLTLRGTLLLVLPQLVFRIFLQHRASATAVTVK